MNKILLLAVLLFLSLNLFAQTDTIQTPWIPIFADKTGSKYFMRNEPIRKLNGWVKIWTQIDKYSYTKRGKKYTNGVAKLLIDFNCKMQEYKVESVVVYDAAGRVAIPQTDPERGTEFIVPDTLFEVIYNAVCKKYGENKNY